jgi:hypothetical protein
MAQNMRYRSWFLKEQVGIIFVFFNWIFGYPCCFLTGFLVIPVVFVNMYPNGVLGG